MMVVMVLMVVLPMPMMMVMIKVNMQALAIGTVTIETLISCLRRCVHLESTGLAELKFCIFTLRLLYLGRHGHSWQVKTGILVLFTELAD